MNLLLLNTISTEKENFQKKNIVTKKWSKTVLLTSYDYYPNKMFNKNVALGNNMKYV